jgi:hypothetical protein
LNPCAFDSLRAFQARLFSHLSIPPNSGAPGMN